MRDRIVAFVTLVVALTIVTGSPARAAPASQPSAARPAAAADPVGEKLEAAKAAFAQDEAKWQRQVVAWYEQTIAASRTKGDKTAVDAAVAAKEKFEKDAALPPDAPRQLAGQRGTICTRLVVAYDTAIKAYVKIAKDEAATVATRERDAFKDRYGLPKGEPDPVALNTAWKGTLASSVSAKVDRQKASATVTARDDKRVTLRTETEAGAVWDWVCEVDGTKLRVVEMNRIKAHVAKPPPTANITGSGAVKDGVLTLQFNWPQGGPKPFQGTFHLTKEQ